MTKQTPMRDCGQTISPGESPRPFARSAVSEALLRAAAPQIQLSLDSVGTPASTGTWVVVDLETTGLGARSEITEIGAVRVREGRLREEFSSLVRPVGPIPPAITALTGITPAMVRGADPIATVLDRFLTWAGFEAKDPVVLVAHNAPFDIGFLRRAAAACSLPWPRVRVVDTLALARLALPRPIVRNHKLATVASYFGTATVPGHRALGDARATAEVLLGFVDLLAGAGASDVEDLVALSAQAPNVSPKAPSFVADLPPSPGVYHFINTDGDTLYVGSASSLRSRVASYYSRSEKRSKIQRMVSLAAGVRSFPTASVIEARIRELRDISALSPPYNSASMRQGSQYWVVSDGENPRVEARIGLGRVARALGPFGSRAHATRAANAIAQARGECDRVSIDEAIAASSCAVPQALTRIMSRLANSGLFESAARTRDDLSAYMTGVERATMRPILVAERIVWATRREHGEAGWVAHAASFGRHVSSVVVPARTDPSPWIDVLSEATLEQPTRAAEAASWAETALICAELSAPGTRLIEWRGALPWAQPALSPLRDASLRDLLAQASSRPGRRGR